MHDADNETPITALIHDAVEGGFDDVCQLTRVQTELGAASPASPIAVPCRHREAFEAHAAVVHDTLLSCATSKVLHMTFTSDEARAYVAAVQWQFASTMPRIPHWYTVRTWRPELDDAFVAFVRFIQFAGVRMDWPDPPAKPLYCNQYLLLDGWKYWTMGDPHPGVVPPIETPETTILVNRARIEPQQERLLGPPQPE